MSYSKHIFKSGEKLYATQLNEMEEQIAKNEADINALGESVPTKEDLSDEFKANLKGMIEHEIAFVSTSHPYADALVAYLDGEEVPDQPVDPTPDEPDPPVEPEVPYLTHITVVANTTEYNVDTDASALDLTVTAHYSDGNSQIVTGYSISGTVAEGQNTFVVWYGEKSATVTVTGKVNYTLVGGIKMAYVGKYWQSTVLTDNEYTSVTIPIPIDTENIIYAFNPPSSATGHKVVAFNNDDIDNPVDIEYYTIGSWAETDRFQINRNYISVGIETAHADRAYAYHKNSGKILFAGSSTDYYGKANVSELTYNENDTHTLESGVRYVPKIGKHGYTLNSADGSETESARCSISEWLDLTGKTKVSLYNNNPSLQFVMTNIWFCDENKTPLSVLSTDRIYGNGKKENLAIPEGAKYLRLGVNSVEYISHWIEVSAT